LSICVSGPGTSELSKALVTIPGELILRFGSIHSLTQKSTKSKCIGNRLVRV
jgi:hypothetical protein